MQGFIIGTGRSLPDRVVVNAELAEALGTTREWILKQTGIEARRWVYGTETTSDLATEAAGLALQRAGVSLDEIDYLIAGTLTPDHQVPGIGPVIQAKLGLPQVPCLDIRAACCNPLYGFELAAALLNTDRAQNILLIGAEVQSKGLRLAPEAKEISALFADGAGACVISKFARPGAVNLVDVSLFTDGKFARDLAVLAPGTGNGSRWYDDDTQDRSLFYPVMSGKTVILHAARKLSDAARSILQRNSLSAQSIDLMIPHQANENLLLAMSRDLDIPLEKCVSVLGWSGNTSSASILIALDWGYEQQRICSGSHLLFLAFGSGFSWGAAVGKVE